MSAKPHVRDLQTVAEFETHVLERSKTVPVLVDFWAAWCGPCRVLGPILEKEIAALGGKVELVKVDTDRMPDLAMEFGVQGIPAVKAFKEGQLVDEFVGAQPVPVIKQFLARLAPSETADALASAEKAWKAGHAAEATTALRALLAKPVLDSDVKDRALLLLCRVLLAQSQPAEVPGLLAQIDPRSTAAVEIPAVEQQLATLTAVLAEGQSFGGEAGARTALEKNPKDHEARFALASALVTRGAHREALEHFLEIVSRNRKFKDDGARKAMIAIFEQLGHDHELTDEFRRRLQIVL
jgi:putative thioredoxin